ncbi:hypothetical protein M0R45_016554 [Rubus argutus]|uniref:Uncharacterized protein n=1 Tax=Rubus argutus TaxID=59490 RepID=A0AAW1XTQ4_RUBAR
MNVNHISQAPAISSAPESELSSRRRYSHQHRRCLPVPPCTSIGVFFPIHRRRRSLFQICRQSVFNAVATSLFTDDVAASLAAFFSAEPIPSPLRDLISPIYGVIRRSIL